MVGNRKIDRAGQRGSRRLHSRLAGLAAVVFALPLVAAADDTSTDRLRPASSIPVSEIALELSNPVTALRVLDWEANFIQFQGDLPGANEQDSVRNNLSFAWPFRLKGGGNLMLKMNLPLNGDQPYWNPVEYLDYADFIVRQVDASRLAVGQFGIGHDHMGSLGIDIGYSQTSNDGVWSLFGLASNAPTSDDQSARRGQWLLGPEFSLGKMTDWGLYGFSFKHLTNVAGSGEQELGTITTNETTIRLHYAYSMGNGWQIESNPEILYDWEAASGNQWMVPIGGGVSKTFRIGRLPMKIGVEGYYFAASPDRFGPDYLARLHFTPVLSTRLIR